MTRLVSLLFILITFGCWGQVRAQEFSWRKQAPEHYYNGECCYCAPADAVRMTERGPAYLAFGKWYLIPPTFNRPPDPKKPTHGIVICDPEQKKYMCVLFSGGV